MGLLVVEMVAASVAGYTQGLTGFGFALVFTPLLTLFEAPAKVVLLALLLSGGTGVVLLWDVGRHLRLIRLRSLLLGAVVGTPAGIKALSLLNGPELKLLIATTALVIAVLFLFRRPPPFRSEGSALGVAGLLGGFLNGSTSMGGPAPALVVAIQRWDIQEIRAAMVAFNLLSCLLGLGTAAAAGLASPMFLVPGVSLVPFALGGIMLGTWSSRRLSRTVFHHAVIGTIVVTSLVNLVSGLSGY